MADATLVDETLSGRRLEMAVQAASVTVQPARAADIRVQAVQQGGSPGDFTVAVTQDGDTVRVRDQVQRRFGLGSFRSRRLLYTVWVPRETRLAIQVSSGSTELREVEGAMQLATGSGSIQLADVGGPLDARTQSGSVRLSRGRVTRAQVRTQSGGIELEGVAGPLDLETQSGEIRVRGAQDSQLPVAIQSGSLDYQGSLAPESQNTVRIGSGSATVRLPFVSHVRLDAQSTSGSVRSDFALREAQDAAQRAARRPGQRHGLAPGSCHQW